jgi:hypothetical protein
MSRTAVKNSRRRTGARDSAASAPRKSFVQAARLAAALEALARGLPNPWDESNDRFRSFVAAFPASTKLDADTLRSALRIGPRYRIDLSPGGPALSELANAERRFGKDIAAGFGQLATVLRATLTELSLAFARGTGVSRVRVWLFGRTSDGALVGLHSIGTET